MHTPKGERMSGCVAYDASINVVIFGGKLLWRVSAMLLVLSAYPIVRPSFLVSSSGVQDPLRKV